jgi:glycosyltransferase involved in cell wall biosynthesis
VSIGVFYPWRNYEGILEGMQCLRKRGVSSELRIIGSTERDPGYARKIRDIANDCGLSIEILGDIPDSQVHDVLRGSDVFLFVNVDQSWGLSVFEAMNFSLPVVVSRSVGAVELLSASRGAKIVDPADARKIAHAIEEIVNNLAEYRRTALSAYTESRTFTWENLYCGNMQVLFRTLVRERLGQSAARGVLGNSGVA